MRRLAFLFAACAIALSGCVKIESQSEEQLDAIGNVRVTTFVCASGQDNDPNSNCKAKDTNTDVEAASVNGGQLLVAYRVRDGVIAPPTIAASYDAPASGSTTLELSASYSREMEQKAPAVAGEHWVGYLSPIIPLADQHQNARGRVVAEFGLQRGTDGAPFSGTFPYRVVMGIRAATDATEAARPVVCNDIVTKNTAGDAEYCVDSPKGTEATIAGDDRSLQTRDLGVLDGPTVTAVPGTAVSLPFTVRAVGLNGSPLFNLSAGTTVPGAGASTAQSVIAPSPEDAEVRVSVGVPKDTPPGSYDVTLSASTGSQLRSGRGTIQVLGKPALTLSLGKKPKLRKALKNGLPVAVTCDGPCALAVKLGSYGGGKGTLDAAGSTTVTARFRKAVRKRLARKRKLAFKLRVTATGAGGKTVVTRRVKLKR